MNWIQALDLVTARTGNTRFRDFCADEHPDHKAWRAEIVRLAGGEAYPPLLTRAGNAAKALGRFVASGGKVVDQAEYDRRRAICEACGYFDPARDRCRKCSCFLAIKPWGARESCPIDRW